MSDAPALHSRPGFLIRRLHQIHLALFLEECAGHEVTPVQFSVLSVVVARPGLEQARLAEEVGVDRATLAELVTRLEARGLLRRKLSAEDRRVRLVEPTAAGRRLLAKMEAAVARAHDRTVAALPEAERAAFLASLSRLVDANNRYGRAPLRLG